MPKESIAQVQQEFQPVMEELNLRVKELRDLQGQLETERSTFGEGLAETQASIEGISGEIVKLQEEQRKLSESFNMPRLTTEDADKLDQDKRMKAFLKYTRFAAGAGDPLTDEEKRALYPDGKDVLLSPADGRGAWSAKKPEQARALVENATGKILAPEAFDKSIIRAATEISIMRGLATVRPVGSHTEKYRKLTEFSVGYGQPLELGGSATESNVTPTEHYQYVEDAYGLAWFGVDELEDTDIDLMGFMIDSFGRAKAGTEDQYMINDGAGHGSYQPEKLNNSSTITAVTAAGTTLAFDDLHDLMYGYEDGDSTPINPVYQKSAVFIMHPFSELAVMKLKDDDGQYLWQPSVQAGVPNLIRGHRVYTSTDMPVVAASANAVIYGDIRSTYRILDRRGMTMQRLVELKALSGQVGFLFTFRNTGGIIRSEASRILTMAAG